MGSRRPSEKGLTLCPSQDKPLSRHLMKRLLPVCICYLGNFRWMPGILLISICTLTPYEFSTSSHISQLLISYFSFLPVSLPLNPTYKGPVTGCSDTPSLSPVTQTETMLPQIMAPSFSKLLLVCLLLVGLGCGETASSSAVAAAAASFRRACPEGSKAFGSYCYGLFSMAESWDAAEVNCQSQTSGHLVSLMNEAEASFVASLVAESGGSRNAIWIGLYDPNKTRRWKWSSNALFTYQSWATKAPSNTSPGYCVTLTPETGFKNWKDQLCSNKNFYICKFKS